MAQAGRQWVDENCSLEAQAETLEKVYEEIRRGR
jgi:hypothetical protein